jgi:prepilin-type processing-associated H-X9-DG protein
MKPRFSQKRNSAMTLFEVGVVIAVVMILAVVLLPRLARPHRSHSGINCVNNLKQLGLAYRIWAGDNRDSYPMGISVANGGSMELVATGNVVQTFLVMSNELSTPKVLFCPEDAVRIRATFFGGLANSNVSYFVSVDATNDVNPQLIISGDDNFEISGKPVKSGLNSFWTNDPVVWSPTTRHMKSGNIGLADGSVLSTTSKSLQTYLQQTGLTTNRFAIP